MTLDYNGSSGNGLRRWFKDWGKPPVLITLIAPVVWFVTWDVISNLTVTQQAKEILDLQQTLRYEIEQRHLMQENIQKIIAGRNSELGHVHEQITVLTLRADNGDKRFSDDEARIARNENRVDALERK